MTVQDIDISRAIWGKSIEDLKGNTTRKKPIQLVGDIVKIPKELFNLHREVFMTADIFFVNGIPIFVSLSHNNTFIAVSYLEDRKPRFK